jgi:hypothetical protein
VRLTLIEMIILKACFNSYGTPFYTLDFRKFFELNTNLQVVLSAVIVQLIILDDVTGSRRFGDDCDVHEREVVSIGVVQKCDVLALTL